MKAEGPNERALLDEEARIKRVAIVTTKTLATQLHFSKVSFLLF